MAEEEVGEGETRPAPQVSEQLIRSTGIRVGTLIKTKHMEPFIARTRQDGLNLIDFSKTMARIDIAGRFIARMPIERVVAFSSKEYGRTPVTRFGELTGAVALTGRFMPGTFTNPLLPEHIDPELVIVSDPAMDWQAVDEASRIGIPIVAVCDTDNVVSFIDVVIPANNRGRRALAAVFWLLARSVLVHSGALSPGEPMKYSIEEFETRLEG